MAGRPPRHDLTDLADRLASEPPKLLLVDCFGTLLHRIVPSHQVRALAASRLACYDDVGVSHREILARRRAAERQLTTQQGGPMRDHRADDLARSVYGALKPDVEEDEFVERFCALEVAAEATATRLNEALVELLVSRPHSVGVVLVSDTNLTGAMMGELLDHHGIRQLFARCYVSSEMGQTKRSGDLYPTILAALGVSPGDALTVGDNPRSDYETARHAGLASILVRPGPWDATKRARPRALDRDFDRQLRQLAAPVDDGDVFPEFVLTLWLFAHRLHRSLIDRKAPRAVFLAREGRFLREIYRRYERVASVLPGDRIPTDYLPVSRKSTFLLAGGHIADRVAAHLERHPGSSYSDVVGLLGIEEGQLRAPGSPPPRTSPSRDDLIDSLARPEVARAMARHRDEQAQLLRELLDPLVSAAALHVVDVGWKGTVQDNLAALLEDRAIVTGHYLGIASSSPSDSKLGLVFTNQPDRSPYYQVFSHFKALYEILLAAPSGSVARYYRAADGSVGVHLDDNDDELRCHREMVAPLQARWASRFDHVCALMAAHQVPDARALATVSRHHGRMMYRPRAAELDFAEKLVHHENFGRRVLDGIGAPGDATVAAGRGLRRYVAGGGWPPLRMRRAGRSWLRHPYGLYKSIALRSGRLS